MTSVRGFETFEHTADIGIRAWGCQFSEVFEEAGKALFSVMVDLETVTPSQTLSLELASESGEELFLKWLKELLFIFETKHLVFSQFKVELSGGNLKAEISGEALNHSKHKLGREVKAITLHQFKLVKEKSRYLAEVILDI